LLKMLSSEWHMQPLFRRQNSLSQVTALDWRIAAIALMALISSQGCGIVADPNNPLSSRGVPPSESQPSNLPTDKLPAPAQQHETLPTAKIPAPSRPTTTQTGLASWYGPKFHGKVTASGEVFNQDQFTAAHPTLPWGSRVKVINLDNGKSVDVRINDRGPFKRGRIIDLSRAAARALGMVGRGITTVRIESLSDSEKTNELALQDK
jgi:rare lipoprotein A